MAQLREDHIKHNKFLRSIHEPQITFDAYVDYVYGKSPKHKANSNKSFSFSTGPIHQLRGSIQKYKSHKSESGSCLAVEPKVYTGTLVRGISTLHKSNAVPVISESEMIEHANMRR